MKHSDDKNKKMSPNNSYYETYDKLVENVVDNVFTEDSSMQSALNSSDNYMDYNQQRCFSNTENEKQNLNPQSNFDGRSQFFNPINNKGFNNDYNNFFNRDVFSYQQPFQPIFNNNEMRPNHYQDYGHYYHSDSMKSISQTNLAHENILREQLNNQFSGLNLNAQQFHPKRNMLDRNNKFATMNNQNYGRGFSMYNNSDNNLYQPAFVPAQNFCGENPFKSGKTLSTKASEKALGNYYNNY
jgi:hypothetical protein